MKLIEALLLLFVLLFFVVWTILVWKGLNPLRLLRSTYKSPKHYLTPASLAERERLLKEANAPGPRTGNAMLYAESVARFAEDLSVQETEELIQFIHLNRLVNTDVKAQHFAQHCRQDVRLEDLPPATISLIIVCLQRYAKFDAVAECLKHCFEAKRGAECLALKTEVERHLCLYRLLYHYLQSSTARVAILKHFEREAEELKASPEFTAPVKLLCDIDDTMLSVLFDTRYPELTVYPGVHQFVHEINSSTSTEHEGSALNRLFRGPRIAFLTARPELLRRRSMRELRTCGFFHYSLLMGRLSNAVLGPERIAAGKLEGFSRYRRVFPEFRFIFVGDNGQGDIDLGKEMLRHPDLYGVSAVLIHDVVRNHERRPDIRSDTLAITPYRWNECIEHGIHSFRTYISAIFHLYTLSMVDAGAVMRVITKTTTAYSSITFDSEGQREKLAREIAADIVLVMGVLPEAQDDAFFAEMDSYLRQHVDTLIEHRADVTADIV
ncbi:hypothetical protein Poli38472_008911 [Pythium oligandrum]|uniref:Phosphatidate phosphatase APP1 catalytic domain-containing protein n=1 Tax=Pythium oligandrum TaxID=41045 RepID=A0A8K1FEX8_PYTOL|nr:hypothetical protein Poli38472_008911 [Pythium oligandrum]|eukprot:TMW56263.1 hypothetical protein Poli38472_008911 [Pythium oligandrum]